LDGLKFKVYEASAMLELNPYHSSAEPMEPSPRVLRPRSTLKWVATGFVITAFIPLGFAVYGAVQESWAAAAMSSRPRCGMDSIATMIMLGIGTPCFGCVGGAVGWIVCKVPL
jgi:hypothetical protein